ARVGVRHTGDTFRGGLRLLTAAHPTPALFPYTTLFRSLQQPGDDPYARNPHLPAAPEDRARSLACATAGHRRGRLPARTLGGHRSEEHTSELQSRENLVCRLLLEKKKTSNRIV